MVCVNENVIEWPPPRQKHTIRKKCRLERGHIMKTYRSRWGQMVTACIICGEKP